MSTESLDRNSTDKPDGFHMNTRRKSQDFQNQIDITGQSTIGDQKDNKPLTSFAIKDEDMVKEQDLLETNKSCLISSDPILSDYVIDAVWKDMKAMKDWKCIISMLLDDNPRNGLTEKDPSF